MKYTRHIVALLIAAVALVLRIPVAGAQQTSYGSGPISESIAYEIDTVLNTPELRNAYQGVLIESAKDGHVLYNRYADHVFMPASNNKLLTGSAALGLLGTDYRYTTTIYSHGTVIDGVVDGDLIISGSGDPTLSAEDLRKLAADVAAAGVKSVSGSLQYVATLFDNQWLGEAWEWDDEQFYYAAQISGLNVNRNVAEVSVTGGDRDGAHVSAKISPVLQNTYEIDDLAVTRKGDGKPHISITRLRGRNTLKISGTIPPKTALPPVSVTFEDPAHVTATLLRTMLEANGITFGEATRTVKGNGPQTVHLKVVAEHVSAPLSDILVLMNKPSDNMIAECLLKTVGAVKSGVGTAGASGTGATAAKEWYTRIGLEPNQLRQVDGSGLSRQDYVSPNNLVRLLRYWAKSPDYNVFLTSLPIAGVDGTLRNRMKGTAAANNCRAKTGSIGQVSCISGYVTTRDGQPLVFSIMMNNQLGSIAPCMAAENKIITYLANLNYRDATTNVIDDEPESMKW